MPKDTLFYSDIFINSSRSLFRDLFLPTPQNLNLLAKCFVDYSYFDKSVCLLSLVFPLRIEDKTIHLSNSHKSMVLNPVIYVAFYSLNLSSHD